MNITETQKKNKRGPINPLATGKYTPELLAKARYIISLGGSMSDVKRHTGIEESENTLRYSLYPGRKEYQLRVNRAWQIKHPERKRELDRVAGRKWRKKVGMAYIQAKYRENYNNNPEYRQKRLEYVRTRYWKKQWEKYKNL